MIGGGNSAIQESLFIAKFANRITIVHQFDRLQANREVQEKAFAIDKISFMFSHEPRAFIKNEDGSMTVEVENLKTGNRLKIECDGVFIFAGMKPNMINEDLQNNNGYIITDEYMHTSLPDVFAAGDIRHKPYRQITTAVADAAITAVKELEEAPVAVS